MSALKKLASETAIYGITHTIGRLLNFLLVPLYTSLFLPEEYGVISVLYSVVGFANVLLLYGLETAFFRFSGLYKGMQVYVTALYSVWTTTLIFIVAGFMCSGDIAGFLGYPEHKGLIRLFVFILALDAMSALPLALLRFQNRPFRFAWIRLTNIFINIGANLFFLLLVPHWIEKGHTFAWYNPDFGIGYIVLSNFIASAILFVMLVPQWKFQRSAFNMSLWKEMMRYAYPLIFVGLAGIVNETLDRILLKKMLPTETADFQVGVYSAFYKISIVMTLFVQAFRFGAEPFFFRHSGGIDSGRIYARIMHYFIIVTVFIFLATTVFIPVIAPIIVRSEAYFSHPDALRLVPLLLMANLFLGILYNLNFWYKLSGKTSIGMWVSVAGAVLTICLNMYLIPRMGIMGSAYTTLVVYSSMCIASYLLGRKYYPIPYRLLPMAGYFMAGVLLSASAWFIPVQFGSSLTIPSAVLACLIYLTSALYMERKLK